MTPFDGPVVPEVKRIRQTSCGELETISAASDSADSKSQSVRVYVGTYTRGQSKGIYVCQLNLKTGALGGLHLRRRGIP